MSAQDALELIHLSQSASAAVKPGYQGFSVKETAHTLTSFVQKNKMRAVVSPPPGCVTAR